MSERRLFADQPLNLHKIPSFRSEHFPYSGPYPWLDQDDALTRIEELTQAGQLTSEDASRCRAWATRGYLILDRLIEDAVLDEVWTSYEKAIATGKVSLHNEKAGEHDPWPGRYLNPHRKIGAFCRILKHPELLRNIALLMQRTPLPLQTIASHKGSQQAVHSDSIHMTTYPLGYLTAAWIAFEDIDPESGPLVYYEGSHKLPYVFSKDVGISESEFKDQGYRSYQARYEPFIASMIQTSQLQPSYFHARKGDVLIWHANLLHGGSPRQNLLLSRKAVVVHFFVKGSFVYHDLAASRSRQQYMGTCLLRDESGKIRLFGKTGG